MPPRHELNERFQGYVRRAERVRTASTAFLATLTVLAVVGGATLAFQDIAPKQFASFTSPARNASAAITAQLAAVSSLPWLDGVVSAIYRAVCPLVSDCETVVTDSTTSPQNVKQPPPSKSYSYQVPTSTPPSQPARTTQTNTAPAVRQTPPNNPTTVIREVQTAGVNTAYVDTRIAALAASVQRQFDAMADANATSFRSVAGSSGGTADSVAASGITGTITNAINSALATITDLTSTTIIATNASTTNATTTTLFVNATTTSANLRIASLDCSSLGNGGTLTTNADGTVVCAADDGGSGSVGGSNTQVQFNDGGSLGGDSGFTYDKTADRASVLYASTTALSSLDTMFVGRTATTTLRGDGLASVFPYASSTALSVSGTGYFGTASTTNLTISGASGGILKTNSSGTVSIATLGSDYLSSASSIEDFSDVAAITENYGDLFAWNGSAWADFATSSLAIALGDTTGTLGAARGGTGLSSITAAGILLGNYAGTGWQQLATSTLGLLTTNVAEGSNLYYTDARVQSFVHASSTIPKTYSANTFTALQTFGNASTTNLSASYASSTQGFFGSLSVGSLTGLLKATAGSIATALIDLASDVTGILPVANGGTGWASLAAGAIPYGSGTNAVATTSAGTPGYVLAYLNGAPTWVATSTLSTISGALSGTQLDGVFSSNGLLARTTTGTYASRTLTGTSNQITVTNGDGVSGNPTLSFPSLLALTQASSTQQSVLDTLYVGRTATTTIRGDGIASSLPYASSTALTVSGTAYFPSSGVWTSSGNVGIGTTTTTGGILNVATAANSKLVINDGSASGNVRLEATNGIYSSYTPLEFNGSILLFASGGTERVRIDSSGNVGIGTTNIATDGGLQPRLVITNPSDATEWVGTGYDHTDDYGFIYAVDNATSWKSLALNPLGGNVGIAMTNPSVALDVTGDIEYTGTITDVSDERLKDNIQPLDGALALLAQIDGKSFNMRGSTTTEFGFLAQNVQMVLPEAVSVVDPQNGYLGVSYLEFIPWLVEAVKELANKVSETAHLVIDTITARRVETVELCVDDVCVTRDEFLRMREGQSAAAAGSSGTHTDAAPGSAPGSAEAESGQNTVAPNDDNSATGTGTADAPASASEGGAPDGPSAPVGAGADAGSTEPTEGSSPADTTGSHASTPPLAEDEVQPTDADAQTQMPTPRAANDSLPVEQLRASGSDGI